MFLTFVQLDSRTDSSPTPSWTVAVDDLYGVVGSVNKCKGLQLSSADSLVTLSIPLFDGYVLVIDSLEKIASPVIYVYCIQVHPNYSGIKEAEIIRKIENCAAPAQQLPHDDRPVWRVKPVDNKDDAKGAKGSPDIPLPLTPFPPPHRTALGYA